MPDRRTFPHLMPTDVTMFARLIAEAKSDLDLRRISNALLQQFGGEGDDVAALLRQIGEKRLALLGDEKRI